MYADDVGGGNMKDAIDDYGSFEAEAGINEFITIGGGTSSGQLVSNCRSCGGRDAVSDTHSNVDEAIRGGCKGVITDDAC